MKAFMLSTTDNPFNPFTQFEEWRAYDTEYSHYCLERIDRVLRSSDELSLSDQMVAYNQAVMDTITLNETGMYMKVVDPS